MFGTFGLRRKSHMDKNDNYEKAFSHPRWNDTGLPHVFTKSECNPEQYERIHRRLLKALKEGRITQEDYDDFENN